MNTLRDSIECISNDELMLKELERRDGIYSFIFHELESTKCTKGQLASYEQNAHHHLLHSFEDINNYNSCTSSSSISEQQQQPGEHFSVNNNATMSSDKIQSIVVSTEPILSTTHFHDYLKPWNPPPSLVYDHPQLYAFMANCGFRVRAPPPRFSHVTAPLIRNRRHALKDSPEYKRYGVCLINTPDLRKLFPHDPDVHAPFGGIQKKQKICKFVD